MKTGNVPIVVAVGPAVVLGVVLQVTVRITGKEKDAASEKEEEMLILFQKNGK